MICERKRAEFRAPEGRHKIARRWSGDLPRRSCAAAETGAAEPRVA